MQTTLSRILTVKRNSNGAWFHRDPGLGKGLSFLLKEPGAHLNANGREIRKSLGL